MTCEICGERKASAKCAVCRSPLCERCAITIEPFTACVECEEAVRGAFVKDWP